MRVIKGFMTQTYAVGDGFFVDIIVDAIHEVYEAWLYNEAYGVKELMFGSDFEQETYKEFLDSVEANVDDYKETYMKFRVGSL